jgi:hypothetical protein
MPLPSPPDPFANTDPLWEPWQPAHSHDDDLSMPDLTPGSLKNFLRETAQAAAQQITIPMPATAWDGAPAIEVPRRF